MVFPVPAGPCNNTVLESPFTTALHTGFNCSGNSNSSPNFGISCFNGFNV